MRKETVAIIEASHFHHLIQNFIHHPVKLNSYAEEIHGDHECVFRRKRSTTDHMFCIRQTCTWEKGRFTTRQCIRYFRLQESL